MKTFAYLAALLSLVFSTATVPANHAWSYPQANKPGTLVCVVSRGDSEGQQGNLDAVVMIQNGKLRQPYAEYNEAAQRKFGSQYFSSGRKYRLLFGGGEVGSLTIKGFEMGCNNIHGTASLDDNGKIPAHLSALATNSDSLGRKAGARRAPTDSERAAINRLVEQIYRTHGATRAVLRTVVTTNLTATDLNGDGKFELIGSYTAESKTKARKDLLLLAEPSANGLKPALVKFQSYKLAPEGFDSAVDFVDQLDVDGDGIGEVFVQQHGFDAYGYSIYKQVGGRWRVVYTSTGDAC